MTVETKDSIRVRLSARPKIGAAIVGAAAGVALGLGVGAGPEAVANGPQPSDFAVAVESFGALHRQKFGTPQFSADMSVAPGVIAISIDPSAGGVVPPSPDRRVLDHFDAVAECADADVEIEHRMASLGAIAAAPKLKQLERFWAANHIGPKAIALGAEVPPLYLDRVPPDLTNDLNVARKKRAFILMMLPHVLAVNDEIRAERARILDVQARFEEATEPTDQDVAWLFATFEKYGVDDYDMDTLLARADVIPPALAIAQAAKESGWGGSRFARDGNAMYGQWTWDPAHKGIVPSARAPGKTHRVRAFDSVLDATRAYAVNLNTHGAYGALREMRRDLRRDGKRANGLELTAGLAKYSEIGQRYVRAVRRIIKRNGLVKLNEAALAPSLAPPSAPDILDGVAAKFASNS